MTAYEKLFWEILEVQKEIYGGGMDAEIMALGLAEKAIREELKERKDNE